MRVTFPHMGNLNIIAKTLFEGLDVECIIPPASSKRTLELGTKYAPELACLPLKINLGNFIESIEKGADTIVMAGGCGPCRFGYYSEVQREILIDMGYNVDVITLELPSGNIKEFINRMRRLKGHKNWYQTIGAILKAIHVAIELDGLDKLSFYIRPREIRKGETDRNMKKFYNGISKLNGAKQVLQYIYRTRKALGKIEIKRDMCPLKVGIVGEIYTVIDPFANFNIESLLGNMGIEVDRSLSISHWIIEHLIKTMLCVRKNKEQEECAKPYLFTMIGGHAQETIGNSVIYAKKRYDGIIQLYPFTCMPEIVAQSILPSISTDLGIPIMTLIIDELTGEAGYKTRVEAFVDMISKRKEKKLYTDEYMLFGN